MQAPDITAGRGGLSALHDTFGQLNSAHGFMANALNTFHNQVSNIGGSVYNILNNEELKARQRLRDKVADDRDARDWAMKQDMFKWKQGQARIENHLNQQRINIEKMNARSLAGLRSMQGRLMKAQTQGQEGQNILKARAINRFNENAQDFVVGQQYMNNVTGTEGSPPIYNPNYQNPMNRP